MRKYIVFLLPDIAWYGIEYLNELTLDKPNSLHMAIIKAKDPQAARQKYFDNHLYPVVLEQDYEFLAHQELLRIFENYNQSQIIEYFGEKDGNTICGMISATDESVSPKIAMETIKKISYETIKKLIFFSTFGDIAVSEIEYEG